MERVQYGIADIGFRYAVLKGGFIELNNRKHRPSASCGLYRSCFEYSPMG
jgi:hypothetical protein